jgi:DNA (cytosine-5)-methyltransferase 1
MSRGKKERLTVQDYGKISQERPRLLDLFAGAGGAGEGYRQAGFQVIACDIRKQPHNPHEFYQGDALTVLDILLDGKAWNGYCLSDFAAIHASPPCQEYSSSRHLRDANYPHAQKAKKLITPIRERLERAGLLWVIENVVGSELPDALELCGSMFGLPIRRHRWFSCSRLLFAPGPCRHTEGFYNCVGGKVRGYGTLASGKTYHCKDGAERRREGYDQLKVGQAAMGIDWMNKAELSQAIPPAYTRSIGEQLLAGLP